VQTLRTATFESFLAATTAAANDQNAGWHSAHLHDWHAPEGGDRREYPFADQIASVLPWWNLIGDD